MKRHGNLWPRLISFPNLLQAARKAQRGKRFRPNVLAFHLDLEPHLWNLHHELAHKTYHPGAYRTFTIHEPKTRLISAAPYRDRIVHHALCNILEPLYERSFLAHSYACRKNKGSHAAVRRAQRLARRFPWVLKADILKFFPSLDHQVLKTRLPLPHLVLRNPGITVAGAKHDRSTEVVWDPGVTRCNVRHGCEGGFTPGFVRATHKGFMKRVAWLSTLSDPFVSTAS